MKKLISVLLTLAFMLTMSVAVFAAPGRFVNSPSNNGPASVVDFNPLNDECTAQIIITEYAERFGLHDDVRLALEAAYNQIVNAANLGDLCAALIAWVAALNIPIGDLAVSDLFDISATDCVTHENGHYGFDVTLKHEYLENFVALLHYVNGKWELVENAKVTQNGEHLEFEVDSFSPFAVVVDTNPSRFDPPQTGDNSNAFIYAAIIVVSAAALFVLCRSLKKEKSN